MCDNTSIYSPYLSMMKKCSGFTGVLSSLNCSHFTSKLDMTVLIFGFKKYILFRFHRIPKKIDNVNRENFDIFR